MDVPVWVIVAAPLALLLGTAFFLWRFVRRGTTALHRAAAKGNKIRLDQLLLASPGSINALDLIGFTPLQQAAYWGQLDAVRLLLDHGAEQTGPNGWTPLHYAAAQGHGDVAQLLLERGADVNVRAASDNSTPLHSAVINRHADIARMLLERGAEIEARTKSAWTACHFAADSGDLDAMRVLLEHGTDWQTVNSGEKNPLELAMANGHREIVRLVQEYKNQLAAKSTPPR